MDTSFAAKPLYATRICGRRRIIHVSTSRGKVHQFRGCVLCEWDCSRSRLPSHVEHCIQVRWLKRQIDAATINSQSIVSSCKCNYLFCEFFQVPDYFFSKLFISFLPNSEISNLKIFFWTRVATSKSPTLDSLNNSMTERGRYAGRRSTSLRKSSKAKVGVCNAVGLEKCREVQNNRSSQKRETFRFFPQDSMTKQ